MAEIKKNKAFYIPAFSSGALNQLLQKDTHHPISNKSFRFYQKEDEPLFHYPFILLSAHYGLRDDLTQKYGANRNECVVFGDSGGFQIASGVLEFTEDLKKKIFEWLDAQTTYAINLDLPPYVSTQKKADSLNSFERKMEISEDNFKYFAERVKQREKGTHFLNVQHGRSIQDLERWYKMAEPFADSFDGGWAIGSASFSFFTILQSILWMFKHDEFARLTERKKNTGIRQFVHVLGFSKVRYMFPVLYIQEKLNELGYDVHLTFDSSSPQTMAVRGNYIYTWTKKGFQSTRFPKSPIYDEHLIWREGKLPCLCPVCKNLTLDEIYQKSVKSKRDDALGPNFYGLLTMHNFWQMLNFKNNAEKILSWKNKDLYEEFFDNEILIALKVIDECFADKEKCLDVLYRNSDALKFKQDGVVKKTSDLEDIFS